MKKSTTHNRVTYEVWLYLSEAKMREEELIEQGKRARLRIGSTYVIEINHKPLINTTNNTN